MAETRDALGARRPFDGIAAIAREQPGLVAITIMAVAGLAIAIYLTTVHYAGVALVCTNTGAINCSAVTTSKYSVVPGTNLPITIPGMLWFVVSGGLAIYALVLHRRQRPEPERLRLLQLLWSAAGLLFVLYLVYAEIVLIHSFCEWCTVIHVLAFLTFLIALYRFQQGAEPTLAPARSRTRMPSASSAARQPQGAARPAARAPQRAQQRSRSRRH